MSGVFQNIDPPTPRRVCTPPPFCAGEDTLTERGWGVNILEDARHSSVPEVGKHPDLLVALPTATVFPTNDRKYKKSQFFEKIFEKI